jgi:hypothetical protein
MPDSSALLSLLGWFAVAAVVALGGFSIAVAVRRWTQRDEPAQNFTFQDLRDMRARGEITPQEFAAMRASLLADLDLEDKKGDEGDGGPSDEPGAPTE